MFRRIDEWDSRRCAALDNSAVMIKGVLFGGIPSKQITGKIDTEFLKVFAEKEGYKVLLCKLYPVEWTQALVRQNPHPRSVDRPQMVLSPNRGQ